MLIDLGEAQSGVRIEVAAERAVKVAHAIKATWDNIGGVTFNFNGEVVTVWCAYTPEVVVQHYLSAVARRETVAR